MVKGPEVNDKLIYAETKIAMFVVKNNLLFSPLNYYSTRALLHARMLKEIQTEETIGIFVTFLSLVSFQLGGGGCSPHGYAYVCETIIFRLMRFFYQKYISAEV